VRVLFLTHRLPYAPNRGDRLRAYHMLRALSPHADLELVSLAHDDDEMTHAGDLDGLVKRVHVARVPQLRNLVRGGLSLAGTRPLTHSLLDAPDIYPAIDEIVRTRKPDALFAYCSGMVRFAMAPPLAEIPCVLDMVDADSAKWSALAQTSGFPKSLIYAREARYLSRFEVAAMRHAKTTIVVNEREQKLLNDLDPSTPVIVIENGVDLDSFAPTTPPSEAPSIVFCGVMNYAPNEEGARWIAREVWPSVRQARPDAQLFLVGASPSPAVRALASDADGIIVTGTVPDVKPYLWNASAAAAPLWTARGVRFGWQSFQHGWRDHRGQASGDRFQHFVLHAACSLASAPDAFARAIVDLLALTPTERRARATAAPLAALAWRERLKDLPRIMTAATEGQRG
jgi:sugar transferase (PEP-CTERM/EpsH1 system associated)